MNDEQAQPASDLAERVALIRVEVRFELGLIYDRVNTLVAAEAFLTIAYTTAMSNTTPWGSTFGAVVAPILAVLGLLLALLAWPGVASTARLVLDWTEEQVELLEQQSALTSGVMVLPRQGTDRRRVTSMQQRNMLLFRAVPGLFALVWTALTVVALVLPR